MADICPGCRAAFKPNDITEVLPYPNTKGPKVRWHLSCHQDVYYRDLDNQMDAAAESARRRLGT